MFLYDKFFIGINKYGRTINCRSVGARVFGLHCILERQLECSGCYTTRGPSVRFGLHPPLDYIKASRH